MALTEDRNSGLANQPSPTPDVFQALVNATYEPLRSFYAQERGFTLTEFGTDIYTKGSDGGYKYVNDYTSQLNPDVDFIRDTWTDFYRAINTANTAIAQAPAVQMDSSLKAQRVAEARFLRAFYYFDLVQMYSLLPRFADVFDFSNEKNAEVIWSVQFTADPLTTGLGNQGHLFFLMEYDVLPGMQRDIANGRPFKRFRPTTFFLGLFDRTKDSRYEAQFRRVWYANNLTTIPRDSTGALKFQLGDTAVYVSTTDADTVLAKTRPYRVYTPKTYSNRIFPSLNKFHDPFRLSVNETRGSRDYLLFRLGETYLIAAEALLRDGRPDQGLPYINAVRRRAAIPGQ